MYNPFSQNAPSDHHHRMPDTYTNGISKLFSIDTKIES